MATESALRSLAFFADASAQHESELALVRTLVRGISRRSLPSSTLYRVYSTNLHEDRLVSALKDMTIPVTGAIKPLRIDAVALAHAFG